MAKSLQYSDTELVPSSTIVGSMFVKPDHEKHLKDYSIKEKNLPNDMTLPTFNYLGPGTHVVNNILNGVLPVSETDSYALQHDYDYLSATSLQDVYEADNSFGLKNDIIGGFNPPNNALTTLARTILKLKNDIGLTEKFWTKSNNDLDQEDLQILRDKLNKLTKN